ncbi:type VI secretion system-associated protein VasI [Vibrio chagasii]|uniref:type VI secretion system-associated protein VasI n=1 Tax=Vibrio chagasii TaxID=170679 RepID=UPI002284BB84|nr:type VI secretion system-associated protein VasI [Vibrio chagasii]MCY9829243.1 type VI secretion system-associated protein VasI [Vibrio chagasii]
MKKASIFSLTLWLNGWLFCTLVFANDSTPSQLALAQQCTTVIKRLERLRCFDQAMGTPVQQVTHPMSRDRPQAWRTAFSSALKAQPINVNERHNGDVWLTISMPQTNESPSPVLMMSCINKISRIELALPIALEAARLEISVTSGPKQYWRSDDVGVLFSSARGLPAISMMKAMLKSPRLTLRSNSSLVDGLQFDATDLDSALIPLRQQCGW